jgi:hypothetical protein
MGFSEVWIIIRLALGVLVAIYAYKKGWYDFMLVKPLKSKKWKIEQLRKKIESMPIYVIEGNSASQDK